GTTRTAIVREGLAQLPAGEDDPAVVDAVWQAEGLGTLVWALSRLELPPYDRAFDHDRLLATALDGATLRSSEEVDLARKTAKLWHWRARTSALQADGSIEL